MDSLLVDEDRHQHSQEIISECGKERPHQRPRKDLAEGIAEVRVRAAGADQLVKIVQPHPCKEVAVAVVSAVIVGEGNEDHEQNRDYRENKDARDGQCQQRLVELIVQHGTKVVLSAFELLSRGKDLLRDPVLLHVQPPCVDKSDDEENGQEAVQQNFKRVVAVDPDVGVQHLVVYLSGGHIAQRAELAQPVAAGCDHINDEHSFKDKEQQSPQHLTPGNIAEAHHKVGYLCFPAAPCKGGGAIRQLVSDAPESACDPVPDGFDQRGQPAGDAENEQDNVVPQTLKRVQPEVFQIRQFLHDQSG